MTHDELLAKIDFELKAAEFEDICGDGGHPPTHKALRAIVELHKPIYHEYPNGNTEIECAHCNDGCWGCQEWGCSDCECKCHQAGHEYPCPTIQAIEKELG
jgi:hypothetical protein